MATIAQIVENAAENLGILGEGETLPSYETADLTSAYAEVFAELQADELTTWSSTAAIPDQYAWAIAMLVAEHRAVKYKVPIPRYQQIKAEAFEAITRIRALMMKGQMGQTEIENF